MEELLFDEWQAMLRPAIMGVLAYAVLIVLLRIAGTRSLSKMNAFDFVVTVALGSTLATVLLDRSITLAEGALAFAVLLGMQFAVTWSSVRTGWVRRVVTGEPKLLLHRGSMLQDALRRARVTEEEIRAAARSSGIASMDQIEAVVLETDGSFSVIPRNQHPGRSSLDGVHAPGA